MAVHGGNPAGRGNETGGQRFHKNWRSSEKRPAFVQSWKFPGGPAFEMERELRRLDEIFRGDGTGERSAGGLPEVQGSESGFGCASVLSGTSGTASGKEIPSERGCAQSIGECRIADSADDSAALQHAADSENRRNSAVEDFFTDYHAGKEVSGSARLLSDS